MNVNIKSNVNNCDFKIHLYHVKQLDWHGLWQNMIMLTKYILNSGRINTDGFLLSVSMSQLTRLWYLSHRRPAKAQVSLRIGAVSPEPSLFAHMKYGSRRRVQPNNVRHPIPTACAFEELVYGGSWLIYLRVANGLFSQQVIILRSTTVTVSVVEPVRLGFPPSTAYISRS